MKAIVLCIKVSSEKKCAEILIKLSFLQNASPSLGESIFLGVQIYQTCWSRWQIIPSRLLFHLCN